MVWFDTFCEEQFPAMSTPAYRIGLGHDTHRLAPNRALIPGGVRIEHDLGLLGHSDADIVLHAITDALLGALALGDIGELFPDTDPANKDVDSRVGQVAVELRVGLAVVAVDQPAVDARQDTTVAALREYVGLSDKRLQQAVKRLEEKKRKAAEKAEKERQKAERRKAEKK